jgi:hypothetical protein
VSNQVRFYEKRFPFEEGIVIDHAIEKDFASGYVGGGVFSVPVFKSPLVLINESSLQMCPQKVSADLWHNPVFIKSQRGYETVSLVLVDVICDWKLNT